MWYALTALAVIFLLVFSNGPNAVGGGLTLGFVGGLIAAGVYAAMGSGFQWSVVGKWIVVCVLAGTAIEMAFAGANRKSR